MYHKLLNSVLSVYVKYQRFFAFQQTNKYLSYSGVQNILNNKLDQVEYHRVTVFKGKYNELNSNNPYNVSLAKLEASYKNGQISAPEYRFLVNQLKEKNDLTDPCSYHLTSETKEDVLKRLATVGNEIDKSIYNQALSQKVKDEGVLNQFWRKHNKSLIDKPQL